MFSVNFLDLQNLDTYTLTARVQRWLDEQVLREVGVSIQCTRHDGGWRHHPQQLPRMPTLLIQSSAARDGPSSHLLNSRCSRPAAVDHCRHARIVEISCESSTHLSGNPEPAYVWSVWPTFLSFKTTFRKNALRSPSIGQSKQGQASKFFFICLISKDYLSYSQYS